MTLVGVFIDKKITMQVALSTKVIALVYDYMSLGH